MTLFDLIAAFRTEADDQVSPPLWSDAEIVGYLNDAENEACIRAGLLVDEQALRAAPGKNKIALDSGVLDVLRVWRPIIIGLRSTEEDLDRGAIEGLEQRHLGGVPRAYAVFGGALYLYPVPSVVESFKIRVSRIPLEPLSLSQLNNEPEIPLADHPRLLDWALHRAFSKRDADSFDGNRAMNYADRFEKHFGPRPSSHARRQYRDAADHRVKFHAF